MGGPQVVPDPASNFLDIPFHLDMIAATIGQGNEVCLNRSALPAVAPN